MSAAQAEKPSRVRPGSKQNRVAVTVPPHLRLAMDSQTDVCYEDILAEAILKALGKTDRELRLAWREHVREDWLAGNRTPYCWPGMRQPGSS